MDGIKTTGQDVIVTNAGVEDNAQMQDDGEEREYFTSPSHYYST